MKAEIWLQHWHGKEAWGFRVFLSHGDKTEGLIQGPKSEIERYLKSNYGKRIQIKTVNG